MSFIVENGEEAICDVIAGRQFPPDCESTLQDALDSFSRAANFGMFSGLLYEPERSSFMVTPAPSCKETEYRRWRYTARFIDVGAFKVLLNILTKQRSEFSNDITIQVIVPSDRGSMFLDSAKLLQLAYPGTRANTSFTIEDNLKEPTDREVFIRVDFHNKLTEDRAGAVYDVLDSWQDIIQRGGFPGPSAGTAEYGTLPLTEHYLVSPYLLEFAIYDYIGPIESYDALLNALHRIHRTQNPIVGVELE